MISIHVEILSAMSMKEERFLALSYRSVAEWVQVVLYLVDMTLEKSPVETKVVGKDVVGVETDAEEGAVMGVEVELVEEGEEEEGQVEDLEVGKALRPVVHEGRLLGEGHQVQTEGDLVG